MISVILAIVNLVIALLMIAVGWKVLKKDFINGTELSARVGYVLVVAGVIGVIAAVFNIWRSFFFYLS